MPKSFKENATDLNSKLSKYELQLIEHLDKKMAELDIEGKWFIRYIGCDVFDIVEFDFVGVEHKIIFSSLSPLIAIKVLEGLIHGYSSAVN